MKMRHDGKAEKSTLRAQLGAFGGRIHRWLSTPTTKAMRLIPQQDLDGAAGN